ncbi:sensory box histidine kinase/response regulator [Dissulfuribacter thermophilus]|uniref:histidine kinase n=2 Tax=Dissulfuribacter thermophilus TaxID=1156395 RepID=A0A1B9F8H9_9BACT|nr:sensory box histidine kinase/response regulator [Dissulfuribacter thermophilus]
MVCDLEKRILFANKALRDARGLDVEGQKCFEVLYGRDRQCPWCHMDRAFAGETNQVEAYNELEKKWYSIKTSPIDLGEGQIGCLCILTDITSQKEVEETVEKCAKFLESIVQHAPMIILGIEDGKIQLFNEQCEKVSGYKRDEVLGKDFIELFIPEEEQARIQDHCKIVKEGNFAPGVEFSLKTKEGRLRQIIWNCIQVEGLQGKTLVLCMGIDVTDMRRLEQQLFQAQKMEAVGRMVGGLAHDINNFLTAVRSGAELALIDLSDQENTRKNLKRILAAVERTGALTKQLLTFSRNEMVRLEPVNLNKVVLGLEDMLKKLLGEDVYLKTFLNPDIGLIYADKGQVEQILVNLAINARDAMPNGGVLQIETGKTIIENETVSAKLGIEPGEYVIMIVSDTGEGIDPRIIPYVFDSFFTTKPKGKGTGLGLSMVYSIVKQSGGHIRLYSDQGKGTTFKIYWPTIPMDEGISDVNDLKNDKEVACSRGETVLVVEDDSFVLDTVSGLLERLGYKVLRARNAQEATEIANMHVGDIDLLFTDIVLPGTNGKDLYENIRKNIPDIKVLFTSGYTENVISRHGVLEKRVNFIHKPFDFRSLAKKIREVLDET